MSTLQSVRYCRGDLQVLDQLLLPLSSSFVPVMDVDQAWDVIKNMQVRGAPAIAIVGCLSLAVELSQRNFDSTWELREFVSKKLDHLVTARPTAVNMVDAAKMLTLHVQEFAEQNSLSSTEMKERIIKKIEGMLKKDVENNMLIGKHGADHILEHYNNQPVQILTHCNTGSLATAGYGTALGVVRKLHEKKKLDHVYCTETRPYNQGSRLTAYELVYENMPATLICDSMAAALLQQKKVSAVVVGADRVVANGDTANKIGTYQLSLVAKYHRVPFYVAVPTTSCDFELKDGSQIVIEERPHKEMISIGGAVIAAPGIGCWNPAFDVTPAELITGGIITEFGVFHPGELKQGVQTLKKTLV